MTVKTLLAAVALPLSLALATPATASDFGTADEARSMLMRAVEALKADEDRALQMFISGEGGFKDKDLYPFCGGPDGNFSAHPTLTGRNLADLMDKVGEPLGERIYATAREDEIAEVDYMWPRPGETDPIRKVAYVTKVGDQTCAVGYYMQ